MVLVLAIGFLSFSDNNVFNAIETFGYFVCLDVSMLFERPQNILFDGVFQINFVSVAKTGQSGNLAQVDFGLGMSRFLRMSMSLYLNMSTRLRALMSSATVFIMWGVRHRGSTNFSSSTISAQFLSRSEKTLLTDHQLCSRNRRILSLRSRP